MSEVIKQAYTNTFLRISIWRIDKFLAVVMARGIDSKGKAPKIPFMAVFLSSE